MENHEKSRNHGRWLKKSHHKFWARKLKKIPKKRHSEILVCEIFSRPPKLDARSPPMVILLPGWSSSLSFLQSHSHSFTHSIYIHVVASRFQRFSLLLHSFTILSLAPHPFSTHCLSFPISFFLILCLISSNSLSHFLSFPISHFI